MTDDELNAIKHRVDAITLGTWEYAYGELYVRDQPHMVMHWLADPDEGYEYVHEEADGEFMAHAPADVHALLDAVRDLRSDLQDVHDIVMAMCRLHALRHYHNGERLNELWSKLLVVADIDLAELLPSGDM